MIAATEATTGATPTSLPVGSDAARYLAPARGLSALLWLLVGFWLGVRWARPELVVMGLTALGTAVDGILQVRRPSPGRMAVVDITVVGLAVVGGQLPALALIPPSGYLLFLLLVMVPEHRRAAAASYALGWVLLGLVTRLGAPPDWAPEQVAVLVAVPAGVFPVATVLFTARMGWVLQEREELDRRRRDSEGRLRAVLDSVPVALLAVSAQGEVTAADGAGVSTLAPGGVEMGGPLTGLLGDSPELGEALAAARGGEHSNLRCQVAGRFWDVWVSPGESAGARVVALDASGLGAAQQVLADRERWFRNLIEHSHDTIAVVDTSGVLTFVSGSVRRMLGYQPEEMVGLPATEFLHPEDRQRAVDDFRRLHRSGERTGRIRWRVRHKEGGYRQVEASVSDRRDDPTVGAWVLNERDVTDRLEAEAASRARSDELGALQRITAATLRIDDLRTAIDTVVDEMQRTTGFPVATVEVLEPEGTHVQVLGARGSIPRRLALAESVWSRRALESGQPVWESYPCGEQGCPHPYGLHTGVAVPMVVDGNVIGVLGLGHVEAVPPDPDSMARAVRLADHVALLVYRRQLHSRLEQLLRSKDEFVAAVSHELRTPLTAVVGLSEELRQRVGELPGEEVAEFAGIIAGQSAEVAHLVEDLLVAARAETGALTIRPEPLELQGEARRVVERERLLGSRTVELEFSGSQVRAHADPARVRQIVRNLVTNALRYGGSRVWVETGEAGPAATLRVVDDGPGIPEEDRTRIFDPYYRAAAVPGVPGSVGLGLTVARSLARMMGGDLRYDYQEGKSVFELTLPRSPSS